MTKAKPNLRTVKRGDGYISVRENRAGELRYQARWQELDTRGETIWRSRTFSSDDDAEDHLRAIGRSKRSGAFTPESKLTLNEIVAEYLERGRSRWSTATVAQYRGLLRNQIEPSLGRERVADLTPRRVQAWIDSLHRSGLGYSVISNAKTVVSGALDEAARLGIVRSNPAASVSLPRKERSIKQTWSPEHVERVLDAADGSQMYGWYVVALTTGMRPGEIRALMWDDIDLERGKLTISRTMTKDENYRHVIGGTTKTRRVRSVAIPPSTVDALRALKIEQAERRLRAELWNATGVVFDRGDGNPHAQQTIANRHRATALKAGVPEIRLHDLRHTAATLMLRNGTPAKIVADILGHSSIQITLDIYSHVDVDMQRSATDQLGELVRKRRA